MRPSKKIRILPPRKSTSVFRSAEERTQSNILSANSKENFSQNSTTGFEKTNEIISGFSSDMANDMANDISKDVAKDREISNYNSDLNTSNSIFSFDEGSMGTPTAWPLNEFLSEYADSFNESEFNNYLSVSSDGRNMLEVPELPIPDLSRHHSSSSFTSSSSSSLSSSSSSTTTSPTTPTPELTSTSDVSDNSASSTTRSSPVSSTNLSTSSIILDLAKKNSDLLSWPMEQQTSSSTVNSSSSDALKLKPTVNPSPTSTLSSTAKNTSMSPLHRQVLSNNINLPNTSLNIINNQETNLLSSSPPSTSSASSNVDDLLKRYVNEIDSSATDISTKNENQTDKLKFLDKYSSIPVCSYRDRALIFKKAEAAAAALFCTKKQVVKRQYNNESAFDPIPYHLLRNFSKKQPTKEMNGFIARATSTPSAPLYTVPTTNSSTTSSPFKNKYNIYSSSSLNNNSHIFTGSTFTGMSAEESGSVLGLNQWSLLSGKASEMIADNDLFVDSMV